MVKIVRAHLSKREQKLLMHLFDVGFMKLSEFSYNSNFVKRMRNAGVIAIMEEEDLIDNAQSTSEHHLPE